MNFTIIGSGGCVSLPKPLCKCQVCEEARKKGKPYSRFGCSLYLEDVKLLVDTPEDIVHAINYSGIDEINSVLFSHMDPDHTLGMRVFEQLRLNWFEVSKGEECKNPVMVYAMDHVMRDINSIGSVRGAYMDYYENVRNIIKRNVVSDFIYFGDVKLTFVKAGVSTAFVFEQHGRKAVYAPCDVKPFPINELFRNADILIIGNTIVGEIIKDGFKIDKNNSLFSELFTMEEIDRIKNTYNIHKVIITHLEEDWGKSYDDYLELEKQYKNITFAYDGMKLKI